MPRALWVVVRVAFSVAFSVAIRTATPSDAENPCVAAVCGVPFSGRQGSGSGKRTARGTPRVRGGPEGHGALKEAAWVPRPFWVVLWDPIWDPFWGQIRTGSPSVPQNPCTAPVSGVRFSTRQRSGLRRCSELGTVPMPGTPGERRLARAVDRWSHGRPANRADAGEEVWG
jgi:hypothetical protein